MRFLWLGKKKPEKFSQVELMREPQEIFSVTDFISINNPISGTSKTGLTDNLINSAIFSLLSKDHSAASLAAQTFFQSRGAILMPMTNYSLNPTRGHSARLQDGELERTILIGTPTVIARVTTPFCEPIAQAVQENPNSFVVAIDGIAYASYQIASEM